MLRRAALTTHFKKRNLMDTTQEPAGTGYQSRNAGRMYRMPWGFGPSTGPRMHVDGSTYDLSDAPRVTSAVNFLSDADALTALLPPGFSVLGEPVVTVDFTHLAQLEWLAGRSYSMLGVRFNARYLGTDDDASGPFLAVLWENRPEPVLTGREELGFAKLYCELPPERYVRGRRSYSASWDGHEFLRMHVEDLRDAEPPAAPPVSAAAQRRGTLHYRYLPRISRPGEAEVAQAVLTPNGGGCPARYEVFQRGAGKAEFRLSTWEQIPTMHHIVNTLARLPVREWRAAHYSVIRGGRDFSDQQVLR